MLMEETKEWRKTRGEERSKDGWINRCMEVRKTGNKVRS